MKSILLALALCGALSAIAVAAPQAANQTAPETAPVADEAYLFCYFLDPNGIGGLHLAWSEDGLKWQPLGSGRNFFHPEIGAEPGTDPIMRDPSILRGPDGTYHLVWTANWNSNSIGYASSKDLVHWSPQQEIRVMGDTPGVKNCWAPEMAYDAKRGEYIILWSSSVAGRFPETQAKGDAYNNRIYSTTTKDFKTFSPPRLFFNPGFGVIDATIASYQGRPVMVFKDETLEPVAKKNLRVAWSDDVQGPYSEISAPFTPPFWVEGPSVLKVGELYNIYFDAYDKTTPHYGAMQTRDFRTFTDISDQVSFPGGTKHGSAFKVPHALLEQLRAP